MNSRLRPAVLHPRVSRHRDPGGACQARALRGSTGRSRARSASRRSGLGGAPADRASGCAYLALQDLHEASLRHLTSSPPGHVAEWRHRAQCMKFGSSMTPAMSPTQPGLQPPGNAARNEPSPPKGGRRSRPGGIAPTTLFKSAAEPAPPGDQAASSRSAKIVVEDNGFAWCDVGLSGTPGTEPEIVRSTRCIRLGFLLDAINLPDN